MLFSDC